MNFNACEILEMAVQIERNGTAFYKTAAGYVNEEKAKKLLLDLADWEVGHEKIFSRMKEELAGNDTETTSFDPGDEAALYVKAFSDGQVFNLNEDPEQLLKNKKNIKEILLEAIKREKDAIVFFSGFLDHVPPALGKERIEAVIREEISHISQLNNQLSELEK